MSNDRDQTPAPTQPNPEPGAASFSKGDPGDETEGADALQGEYLKDPKTAVDRVYKKDKDPDERALGSDEGHRSQAPDYEQLLREDETERPGRG